MFDNSIHELEKYLTKGSFSPVEFKVLIPNKQEIKKQTIEIELNNKLKTEKQ